MRRSWWLVSLLALASLSVACGNASGGGDGDDEGDDDDTGDADGDGQDCLDNDHDGAGIGDGCAADDCDDTDPRTVDQCGTDCASNPQRVGCPCNTGEVVACYMGPDGTGGVGVCAAGLKQCGDGEWGPCDGQQLPVGDEECNSVDDNCDGQVDEGVTSACGDCNPDCVETCVGVGCEQPFDLENGRSIVQNADGSLTLSGAASVQNFVIWVANSQEGTVSKINTRTLEEEGRYRTASTGQSAYPDPSRTTVNPHGDVVVSNRQHGSSTKILASDCPDRDGDGVVETSTGTGDILDWDDVDDPEDECIMWNVDGIPAARGSAFEIRSELDGGLHEWVWVGSYPFADSTIFEIDSEEGEKTGREIPTTGAYGLAVGPGGLLWSVGLGGCPISTDTTTLEQTHYSCPPNGGAYGIAVDGEGRVWIGSATARLTPWEDTWETPIGAVVSGGGITVDAFGNAYTGEFGWGSAYKIDGETMETTALPGMGGHGWAVDFDGKIWSVDMIDAAHVWDPETEEVTDVRPPLVGPYTYSDMTGFGLQNTITPAGVYEQLFEACEGDESVHPAQIEWDADLPNGTALSFRFKSADTVELLDDAQWYEVGTAPPSDSPLDLYAALEEAGVPRNESGDLIVGRFIRIEVTIQSIDRLNRPTLNGFLMRYSCFNIFG